MFSPLALRANRIKAATLPVAAGLVLASAGISAQESGSDSVPKRAVSILPRVAITETVTDNVHLSSGDRQADRLTEISPGIRISVEGERLKSYFDYSLNEVLYAKNSSDRRTQNSLNAFGTLEAVDNFAFLDFSGSISRQAISAFGKQSIADASINANQTEVSSYRVSPYLRGRLGSMASYDARYSRAVTRSDAFAGSDVTTEDGVARVSGGSIYTSFGWSADASRQRVEYSAGRSTEVDRFRVGLSYEITPQLSVLANAGSESNNYTSFDMQRYGTGGVGLNWSPSETTKLSASRDYRSFGDAHSLRFEHRTGRTAWIFTDSRDVSVTPSQTGVPSMGAIYDLLYIQFASIEPDPVSRAQLVNAYLQSNGISPNARVISSFLTSAVSLQRRQDLSFALLGARDTITFIATRSVSSRLDALSTGFDDLTTSALVRQRGFSVNFAHRLTPDYSLSVLASLQDTSGASSLQDTTLRLLNVNVTGKVGRMTTASVGVRRVVSSGNTATYAETAVTGNLNVQF